MIETGRLITYLATLVGLFIAPGPSVVLVVNRAITAGRRAGLVAAAGNTVGLATQLAVVVIGPAELLGGSAGLFLGLKLAGAAVLILLGARTLVALGHSSGSERERVGPAGVGPSLRQGWVVGVTNPKGLVTFTSIAPSVIQRHAHEDIAGQIALLGLIGLAVALACDGAWALLAGQVRAWFARSPRRLAAFTAAGGVVMIGFGVGLALIALL